MLIFEAIFKGASTRFGLRPIENLFENPHFIFCSSFQNLRLGEHKIMLNISDRLFELFFKYASTRFEFTFKNAQKDGLNCFQSLFGGVRYKK